MHDNADDSLPGSYNDDGGGSSVGDNCYDHIDTGTHIIKAVINAMKLTEEVNGSQQNIINYGKELYYKGKGNELGTENEKLWPKSWQCAY